MKPYTLPPSYHLGGPGCGCFLEPPGHPTYFVRPVYTKYGNHPAKGPGYYIDGKGTNSWDEVARLYGSEKYPKLPLDHPRTRLWIKCLYGHMQHCYRPSWAPQEYGKPGTIIYPVQDWDEKSAAAVKANGVPKVEDHAAVLEIRKFYPEYQPEQDLIDQPPVSGCGSEGSWWETESERPTPETCKPRYEGGSMSRHPINGTWCQWCGWVSSEADLVRKQT